MAGSKRMTFGRVTTAGWMALFLVQGLSGCASDFDRNKRSAYGKINPDCPYEQFNYAPPFLFCEGQIPQSDALRAEGLAEPGM